ncbi:MAG TPA: PadR family transcriptional regulator [Solirubrobacteraceae bacterium]
MTTRDPGWMRGSSPLKGALLGLLLQRPGHGYDLANRLGRRLGPAWQIEAKGLYPMLQQLERAGLVSPQAVACNGPTGRRIVYHPTIRAQSALTEWMTAGAAAEPVRVELQAKLAVARYEDLPRLLLALDCYEQERRTLLSASAEEFPSVRSLAELAMTLTRAAALTRLRAELDWAVLARRAIAEFAAATKTADCPAPRRVAARPARGAAGEGHALHPARR